MQQIDNQTSYNKKRKIRKLVKPNVPTTKHSQQYEINKKKIEKLKKEMIYLTEIQHTQDIDLLKLVLKNNPFKCICIVVLYLFIYMALFYPIQWIDLPVIVVFTSINVNLTIWLIGLDQKTNATKEMNKRNHLIQQHIKNQQRLYKKIKLETLWLTDFSVEEES